LGIGNFAAAAIRELRADGLDPAHYDMRFVKPLDQELLHEVFGRLRQDPDCRGRHGGRCFGSQSWNFNRNMTIKPPLRILGIPTGSVEHGTLKELQRECGFDAAGIASTVREMMKDKINVSMSNNPSRPISFIKESFKFIRVCGSAFFCVLLACSFVHGPVSHAQQYFFDRYTLRTVWSTTGRVPFSRTARDAFISAPMED